MPVDAQVPLHIIIVQPGFKRLARRCATVAIREPALVCGKQFNQNNAPAGGVPQVTGVLAEGQDVSADVYKVAHHGSKHSSEAVLLRAVHPSIAVIEVGRVNDYGHPAPETLERLHAVGARVLRTDEDGEVRVTTDGESLDVSTARTPPAPPPGPEPSPVVEGGYVASRRSHVFHRAGCVGASHIEAGHRMTFPSREAAVASGRMPAKDCHP